MTSFLRNENDVILRSCSSTGVSSFKDDPVHLECAWVETLSRERLQLQQTSGGRTGWVLHLRWTSTVPRVSLHEEEGDQKMESQTVSEIHSTIVLFTHTISRIADHSYHPTIAKQLQYQSNQQLPSERERYWIKHGISSCDLNSIILPK